MLKCAIVEGAQSPSIGSELDELILCGDGPEEVATFPRIMRSFLVLDPAQRVGAAEALLDPAFMDIPALDLVRSTKALLGPDIPRHDCDSRHVRSTLKASLSPAVGIVFTERSVDIILVSPPTHTNVSSHVVRHKTAGFVRVVIVPLRSSLNGHERVPASIGS